MSNEFKVKNGLIVDGNVKRGFATYTTTSTLSLLYYAIFINATADITLTLPTAVGQGGVVVNLKRININTDTVTVDTTGTETIDGMDDITIASYENIKLISNNVNWFII